MDLSEKEQILHQIEQKYLAPFTIVNYDKEKPWGAYFCISDLEIDTFIDTFFTEAKKEFDNATHTLSPKLLVVLPNKRLSWQYHFRRQELWKVLAGPVAVPVSQDNAMPSEIPEYNKGSLVRIPQSYRHRLVGLDNIGIVAEIWQHSDPNELSNEDDIIRVEDDFNR